MTRLFHAICAFIIGVFNDLSEKVADGIEERDGVKVASYILLILLWAMVCLAVLLLLLFLGYQCLPIVIAVGFVAALIYGLLHMNDEKEQDDGGKELDEVTMRLLKARARELYEDIRGLIFYAVQGAASSTPLRRLHDEYEIQTATTHDHFYLDGKVVVFQFEDDLESPIDKAQEDIILREIQRNVKKHATRYPLLLEGGHAPEVIDCKNLGGRILIEVVLYNEASRSMIEDRKRARIEREIRQERVDDPRY